MEFYERIYEVDIPDKKGAFIFELTPKEQDFDEPY